MDIKDFIKKTLPNPLERGTLTVLSKKVEILNESFRFAILIFDCIVLVALLFVLVSVFKLPIGLLSPIIALLIVGQIFIIIVQRKAIQNISSIPEENTGANFKAIIVRREYYQLIRSSIQSIVSFISCTYIYFLFKDQIIEYIHSISSIFSLEFLRSNAIYLFFITVVFNIFDYLFIFIKYQIYKNFNETQNIAELNQNILITNQKLSLLKGFPTFIIVTVIFLLVGIPAYIVGGFYIFYILIFTLNIMSIKRIKSVDLSDQQPLTQNSNAETVSNNKSFQSYPDEKIDAVIYGIMNTKQHGTAILGKGKMENTENTMIITNDRFVCIEIPLPGGNTFVGGVDYSAMNTFWNRKEMQTKGEQMIHAMPLSDLLSSNTNNYEIPYNQIINVILNTLNKTISIVTTSNKFKYIFIDSDYIEILKNSFSSHFGDKFTIKSSIF